MRNSPEYNAWRSMKKRCLVPTTASHSRYGGRGITVCERWMKFENFYADVGPRPSALYSIDRFPNPDGNYEPGNVRWATDEEQNRNRGDYNVIVTFNGTPMTVGEWSKITGRSRHLVYERLKRGWTPEQAISAEPHSTRGQRHIGMRRSAEARWKMSQAQLRRWAKRKII
jgi:hypothetical protein